MVTVQQDSLMGRVLAGQDTEASLGESHVLADAVGALVAVVEASGGVPVRPAGKTAALLVGGAVLATDGRVRQAALHPGGDNKVLLVEAVAVGGAVVARAVAEARRDGADWVGVWVWRASDLVDRTSLGADEVTFADEDSELLSSQRG